MNKVYEIITDTIIKKMEKGKTIYNCGWHKTEAPKNYISNKAYRGVNQLILTLEEKNKFWLTWKQIQQIKGKVKKGSKAKAVIFWDVKKFEDRETGEEIKRPLLKYYNVFSLEDLSEFTPIKREPEAIEKLIFKPVERAEAIKNRLIKEEELQIIYGGSRACYIPSKDKILLPKIENFKSIEDYYSTLHHEIGHWTGHEKRQNREELKNNTKFGSNKYSEEELTAELFSCFMAQETGIEVKNIIDNSTAYIQSWIRVLKNDKKFIFKSATKAQKAIDFVMQKEKEEYKKIA